MDPRRALPLLLLAVCVVGAASPSGNGRDGQRLVRRVRRISLNEYLVPPPPPKFHPAIRTGRLATAQPPTAEEPGYFSRFMSWLNPFNYGGPPSPHVEAPYPPSPKFIQPAPPPSPGGPPAKIYDDPSPLAYDRPRLPPRIFDNHPEYSPPAKAKNCHPCDKIPWMPMQHGELSHSRDTSFILPPALPPPTHQIPSLNGAYLPPSGGVAHDAHHVASQEIRVPDFSFAPPLPTAVQETPFISPLPNPHLYPGPMPPLFKAVDFHHPIQAADTLEGSSDYIGAPPPSESGFHAENEAFPSVFNGARNEQSAYADASALSGVGTVHQGLGYINSGTGNGEFQHLDVQNQGVHGDLSSSGTQVSHIDPVLGQQGYEDIAAHQGSFNAIHHQTSVGSSGGGGGLDHQTSNNGQFYEIIGPNGSLSDEPLDNSSRINQDRSPSSYGISDLGRAPSNYEHRYNDLSSSGSAVKDSRAPPLRPDGTSATIENLIHIEESPLLDLTRKGESRTYSSPIPPTSNVFVDPSKSGEIAATTLAPGDELYDAHRGVASTESHFAADHLRTIGSSGTTRDFNGSPRDAGTLQSSGQTTYLWPTVPSTTTRITEGEPFLSTLVKFYDGIDEDTPDQNVNVNSEEEEEDKLSARQQSTKRNKQVQVIIPYTSQYTPFPFHSSHEQKYGRKDSHASESNRDNYVSEESRKQIKVANLPDGSHTFQTWPTTAAILENVTRKPTTTKTNNSIDVHRLQKNIDNWTIQEYSKGTTVSTVSPSSVNPYLFPSKQIPDEYLTTTEPVSHADAPHDDNVKTFTLAGFSFNDLDHEGSASSRVEGSRVQVVRNGDSKSTENPDDTATKSDITWQGFSVDISPVNKERVYVVTPQPIVTTSGSRLVEQKKEKATKEAEKNPKESKETDTKKTRKKSNTFELIEKAYQVLPQAVNNLAVASTGPESVPLWGIIEHEEFASLNESEQDNEDNESPDIPVLYAGHSKVSRARR